MTPQARLAELEARLRQAIAADAEVRPTPEVNADQVRARLAGMARSLGDAWNLQAGFNPYEAKAYNPDQPRDERGRFGSGGSSSATVAPSTPGIPITLQPTWQSTRAPLDTSRLNGAAVRAIDPPNLPAEVAEQRLLALYDRAVAQGHAPKDANWYVDRHNLAGKWADDIGVDRQRFIDAVAATSPLTAWDLANSPRLPNLEAARAMVLAERAHPDLSPQQIREMVPRSQGYPFLGNSAENAVRALRGEDPNDVFKANKIRSFNNDMSHPQHPTNVTIDTHMGRLMLNRHDDTEEAKKEVNDLIQGRKLGRGPVAQTLGGYGWAADRVRAVAATKQMVPSSFQAIVWEQWRREGGAVTTRRAAKMTKSEDDLTEAEVWDLWQDVIAWAEAGAPANWRPDEKTGRGHWVSATETKYNPYHEEGSGRFTSSDEAGFVSLAGKPAEHSGEVVGRGKDLPTDVSPARMAAKRAAMVEAHTRRDAAISHQWSQAQKEYDKVSTRYMETAHLQRVASDHANQLFDKLEVAKDQAARGVPGAADLLKAVEPEFQRAEAVRAQINAQVGETTRAISEAQQKFDATIKNLAEQQRGLNDELRAKYINAPEGPANIAIRTPDAVTPPQHWTAGVQAINEIIGQGAVADGRRGDASLLAPQARIAPMEPSDAWYASGRSYHTSVGGGAIAMHPNDTRTSTVVHEMGHWVENKIPGLPARIEAHIQSRTEGEAARSLGQITGANFNANEVTKPDKFADPYMGKEYGGSAHEFLSMSVQLMYEDPVAFAKKDPQSFDFTMQVLAEARQNGGTLEDA